MLVQHRSSQHAGRLRETRVRPPAILFLLSILCICVGSTCKATLFQQVVIFRFPFSSVRAEELRRCSQSQHMHTEGDLLCLGGNSVRRGSGGRWYSSFTHGLFVRASSLGIGAVLSSISISESYHTVLRILRQTDSMQPALTVTLRVSCPPPSALSPYQQ